MSCPTWQHAMDSLTLSQKYWYKDTSPEPLSFQFIWLAAPLWTLGSCFSLSNLDALLLIATLSLEAQLKLTDLGSVRLTCNSWIVFNSVTVANSHDYQSSYYFNTCCAIVHCNFSANILHQQHLFVLIFNQYSGLPNFTIRSDFISVRKPLKAVHFWKAWLPFVE